MTNMLRYRGNQGNNSPNLERGPSPYIWADCPWLEIHANPNIGYAFFDDFLSGPTVAAGAQASYGLYKGFADTGGSVVDAKLEGGVLTASSDGDNEGASLAMNCTPFQISRDTGKLWFEARVRSSTIDNTKHGFVVGLWEEVTLSATVPIAAAGTLADQNFVGFHRLEGDGDAIDTVYKANGVTQVTVAADAIVLAADEWVKLGMVYDPNTFTLTFFLNGKELPDKKVIPVAAGTDFPNDVRLGMLFAVLNATATTPGSSSIDWWRCAMLTHVG